ncbi:TfoX/Sxy family protein [Lewinella cohaerens]|uniref:TfoX/Sxy family protein n=1 Tax=Lewinella cohaerens TaxID=70995 RepID=UPI00036E8D4C|nr:TfoX/Sxy family protein [Lewinella cohaerens]
MAVNPTYVTYVEEQLSEFGTVELKKMFGGIGIFHEGLMFGMIGSDIFRLKVDEHNQADFENLGVQPYASKTKKKGMPYWEVPAEILEDCTLLAVWAKKSFAAAQRSAKK